MNHRRPALSTLVACVAACTLVTGCLFTNKSYVRYSGKTVEDRALSGVVIGETTKDSLIADIGEPTSIDVRGGAEILRYQSKKTTEQTSALFLVFRNQKQEEQVRTIFFEFRNGLLQRYWTE